MIMRKTWIAIVATVVLGVTIYGGYHAYGYVLLYSYQQILMNKSLITTT